MGLGNGASSSGYVLDASGPLLLPVGGADHNQLSSQPNTFANVFISVVGSGVLGLPYAFSRTGWFAGAIILLAVAALTCYCMMLLVHTRRRLDLDRTAKIASFGDLGLAVYGPLGRLSVDLMIVLSQAGFCVGYLIFISNSLTHLLPITIPFLPFLSSKAVYVLAMLPFQLGLNSIKTLTLLAPLSIFADVVEIGAMGVVIAEDVSIMLSNRSPLHAFSGPSILLYGTGVAVYAFEGIGMILPLEAEAADKPKFGRTLGLSMAFIALLYGLFGVLGYAAFGNETKDIITTNLGAGVLTVLIQMGLCINLFFTFPIMMNPVYEVAERWLRGKRYSWWLRWLLVVVVSLAATSVPNFTDFLSLVGSSVCVVLGFVLPAVFHLKTFSSDLGWIGATADIAIIVVGMGLAFSGTCYSVDVIEKVIQRLKPLKKEVDPLELALTNTVDGDIEGETEECVALLNANPSLSVELEENQEAEGQKKIEFKSLPNTLRYEFLGENSTYPVIVSAELDKEQTDLLLQELRLHRKVIGYSLDDIKGINPSVCMHKILLEENSKPSVEFQQRLNPHLKEVVKKEVLKLLDTGVIYPISDSSWVSPVHVVPKKGGVRVIKTDIDELIPTRTVTGYRMCIDYRKLNFATRRDHFPLPFIDQMLDRLAHNVYFCFLDEFSGFFQIPIHPDDQE